MSERIVFQCHSGGLGDSLLYSTLPELWARQGNEVYIVDGFRNPGVADLVWRSNPFVKGLVVEPNNRIMTQDAKLINACIRYNNSIKGAEAYFGFEPQNAFPRLYCKFEYLPEYRDIVLFDPAAITAPFNKESVEAYVANLCKRDIIKRERLVVISTGAAEFEHFGMLPGVPRITPSSIFEYANMIFSCNTYVTVSSGASAMASAIKGHNPYPKVYALIHQAIWNKHIWKWDNIDYSITGSIYSDYDDF